MFNQSTIMPNRYKIIKINHKIGILFFTQPMTYFSSGLPLQIIKTFQSTKRTYFNTFIFSNKFINKISKTQLVYGARDYRIMCRKMVDAVLQMSEYNRFSKGIFSWVGFKTEWLEYENVERSAGETKWSLRQLFKYSLEGITGFSVAPLSVAAVLGVVFCGVSFFMILFLVIRTLIWGDPVAGWPSMVCVILFMGGIQLLCMGIMGEYLSKTYLESKHRPIYIVRSSSYEKE